MGILRRRSKKDEDNGPIRKSSSDTDVCTDMMGIPLSSHSTPNRKGRCTNCGQKIG